MKNLEGLERAYEINKAGFHIVEETEDSYHLANYEKTSFFWIKKEPKNAFSLSLVLYSKFFQDKKSNLPLIGKLYTGTLILKRNIDVIDMNDFDSLVEK